jgi:peptidoglycan/xylan/chitin deacetylase (PgdA/CDA1 family)
MFRKRRAVAAAIVVPCVGGALLLVAGSGSSSHDRSGRSAGRSPGPVPQKPSSVDRVLGYTDYVVRGSPRRREVALTFDDGPGPYTAKVLNVLRRRHAPATFFPVGQPITEFPNGLKLVSRLGFPIGNHTMTHPLMGHLPPDRQAAELDQQAQLVTGAGVPYPRLFRPPYGSFDTDTRDLIRERHMLMVLWSVNPQDYYRPGALAIVSRVIDAVRPGAIVLMHDGGGDRSQTVAALPKIIRKLRARGYKLVTVERLLRDDPPPRLQGPPPNLAGV